MQWHGISEGINVNALDSVGSCFGYAVGLKIFWTRVCSSVENNPFPTCTLCRMEQVQSAQNLFGRVKYRPITWYRKALATPWKRLATLRTVYFTLANIYHALAFASMKYTKSDNCIEEYANITYIYMLLVYTISWSVSIGF